MHARGVPVIVSESGDRCPQHLSGNLAVSRALPMRAGKHGVMDLTLHTSAKHNVNLFPSLHSPWCSSSPLPTPPALARLLLPRLQEPNVLFLPLQLQNSTCKGALQMKRPSSGYFRVFKGDFPPVWPEDVVHIQRLIDVLQGGLALKGASGEAAFDVHTSCLLTSEASAEAEPGSLRGHGRSRQASRGAASETDV